MVRDGMNKKRYKNFIILLFLFILGLMLYQFRATLSTRFLPVFDTLKSYFVKVPCAEPIEYTLGTFDSRFNISKYYFLNALVDAEAIWEEPVGLNLFSYVSIDFIDSTNIEPDILKINLIYDYCQEATSKLASLGIVVKDSKASYEMLKAKFETLKKEYTVMMGAFDRRTTVFNQDNKTFNKEVNFWNKKGGAPQKEYNLLEDYRLTLEGEVKELTTLQNRINNMANEIDALVVVLNRLVVSLNLSVEKYNTVNASRGESFEEGIYSSDGTNRKIDIYEFSSRDKLIRVLAHELGHALGIEHTEDKEAIMYKYNSNDSLILNDADLAELKIKCGIE